MAPSGSDSDPNSDQGTSDDDGFQLGAGNGANPDATKFTDPASTSSGGNADSGKPAGKRGRPKGSTNKKSGTTKKANLDLGPFAGVLMGIHGMLASISKTPELELDEKESDKLAKASYGVMRHYIDLEVSEKAADWSNLFMAVAGIYGPRIVARKMRRKATAKMETADVRQHQPQPTQRPAPSAGAQVIQMPSTFQAGPPTAGGDFGGAGGSPGVG